MPMVAQWDINDDCNLNCKHCRVLDKNTKEQELKNAVSFEEVLKREGLTFDDLQDKN